MNEFVIFLNKLFAWGLSDFWNFIGLFFLFAFTITAILKLIKLFFDFINTAIHGWPEDNDKFDCPKIEDC